MYSKIDLIESKDSPRLSEDNTLCWYEGEVFKINWNVSLLDDQGNFIEFKPTDCSNFIVRITQINLLLSLTLLTLQRIVWF